MAQISHKIGEGLSEQKHTVISSMYVFCGGWRGEKTYQVDNTESFSCSIAPPCFPCFSYICGTSGVPRRSLPRGMSQLVEVVQLKTCGLHQPLSLPLCDLVATCLIVFVNGKASVTRFRWKAKKGHSMSANSELPESNGWVIRFLSVFFMIAPSSCLVNHQPHLRDPGLAC